MTLKKLFTAKYGHALIFLYALFYLPFFTYLENLEASHYHVLRSNLDSLIPFCEFFIIPYFLWFLLMIGLVFYFFFTSRKDFCCFCYITMSGMTLFLLLSMVYPNALQLRPTTFPRNNFCTELVKLLYANDTPTNVLPSIHVYNTIAAFIAIKKSAVLTRSKSVQILNSILCTSIVLSTLFLKQHSMVDVTCAFILYFILYPFFYPSNILKWNILKQPQPL